MTEFELGQRVTFTHVISRSKRWDDNQRVTVKRWDPWPHAGEGIVYGARTLSNGHVERITEHDGYFGHVYTHSEWIGVHFFAAYYVATHLRQRPVVVLPEHMSAVVEGARIEDNPLPLHRTEAGYPNCSTCDGGGCLDCTDPA